MIRTGKDRRKEFGRLGEQQAERYLVEHGYRIIERNWRCRTGEIDLIAAIDELIIIVEVRTRSKNDRFATAIESIDARKQKQVRDTALHYLHAVRKHNVQVRFDVVALHLSHDGVIHELIHVPNAF